MPSNNIHNGRVQNSAISSAHYSASSWIEISRSALHHNVEILCGLAPDAQLGVVIKSNAYGHGASLIAQELENNETVEWLYTAGLSEAVELRKIGSTKKILAMAYADLPYDVAIDYTIEVTLFCYDQLDSLLEFQCHRHKPLNVQIKVDTGLSRLGLMPHEIVPFINKIKNDFHGIHITGIFTHLADTNNSDESFTHYQLKQFYDLVTSLSEQGIAFQNTHAISSGALTLHSNYKFSSVRLGTNIYGLWKSETQKTRTLERFPQVSLEPILVWKARILEVVDGKALIAVGYQDGYSQRFQQRAFMQIGSSFFPVLSVGPDRTILDVSTCKDIEKHIEVIVLGKASLVSADNLALNLDTLTNELLARIMPHLSRNITL